MAYRAAGEKRVAGTITQGLSHSTGPSDLTNPTFPVYIFLWVSLAVAPCIISLKKNLIKIPF